MISFFLLSLLVQIVIKVAVWLIKANLDGTPLTAAQKEKLNHFIWTVEEKLRPAAVRAGCLSLGAQPPEWTDDLSSTED